MPTMNSMNSIITLSRKTLNKKTPSNLRIIFSNHMTLECQFSRWGACAGWKNWRLMVHSLALLLVCGCVCVGVAVVSGGFQSLLASDWIWNVPQKSIKSQSLFFVPFLSVSLQTEMMLIPRSGVVEWQVTERLIQRERKQEVTLERVPAAGNEKQRQKVRHIDWKAMRSKWVDLLILGWQCFSPGLSLNILKIPFTPFYFVCASFPSLTASSSVSCDIHSFSLSTFITL